MKKSARTAIIILLLLAMTLAGCGGAAETPAAGQPEVTAAPEPTEEAAEAESTPTPEVTDVPEEEAIPEEPMKVVDYEALFSSLDPQEVVMTVNGQEITWNEYFYWISYYAEYIQYYMDMYRYYGMSYKWTDQADSQGTFNLAESVIMDAEAHVEMICIIEQVARENNITLSREDQEELEASFLAEREEFCGEGATEEDFAKALEEEHLTLELYKKFNTANFLYRKIFNEMYGENGALVSDADALGYLENNGYMHANHILFMTVDSSTREPLDEETVESKKAMAENTAAELKNIKDTARLLERFAELKNEYCEDTGKFTYPDGYVFTSGTMVEEFENTCRELEDYQVSDPVQSTYGYHIILRLPNDPDAVIEFSSEGTALSARAKYANEAYSEQMQEKAEEAEVQRMDSIQDLSLLDYLTDAPEE